MKRFVHKKISHRHRHLVWAILISAAVLVIFTVCIDRLSDDSVRRQEENLENALQRTITYCYASEGAYPEDLDYLKSHYGLTWDESLFFVDYHVSAANIYPDVTILELK